MFTNSFDERLWMEQEGLDELVKQMGENEFRIMNLVVRSRGKLNIDT